MKLKRNVTIEESITVSKELGDRFQAHQPESIVCIANGALLIGRVIADYLKLPLHTLFIHRRGSRLKQYLSAIPGLTSLVTLLYHQPALHYRIDRIMHVFDRLSKVNGDQNVLPVEGQVVALVDDCIESGQTIATARQCLHQANAKTVVIGCISWEKWKDSIVENNVQPDIFMDRQLQTFPWSTNSPYRKELIHWLRDRGIDLA